MGSCEEIWLIHWAFPQLRTARNSELLHECECFQAGLSRSRVPGDSGVSEKREGGAGARAKHCIAYLTERRCFIA